ncbi:MAG TPA: endolytic transglycosylase MltG [Candidatus Sulfomarinibacteraceae bacterium]|nr:endolytic transglycosylase MltG [Candidatus Sulfomarinibacteraceae bacterium]
MSIRGGGRPRDGARRMKPGAYDGADMPTWRATDGRGGPPPGGSLHDPRRRGALPGIVKFLLFTVILATVVVVASLTALRPVVRAAIVGWAWDNPSSLRVPFVADFIREDLGAALTEPAGSDPAEVVFEVVPGDTPAALAPRLAEGGFVGSERAFLFTAIQENLADELQAGLFLLRRNMTPTEVVGALVGARIVVTTIDVTFREGLRLEQLTAKLQTITSAVDPRAFYDLVATPTPELLADYPWLELTEGASLEGYLYPATYTLVTSANGGPFEVTTADRLVRMMLDKFHDAVGEARLDVPEGRGLTFYEVLTLASIVEREAAIDEERPLIAGVYQNRLDGKGRSKTILNADPTVLYAVDTMQLRELPFAEWRNFFFWAVPEGGLAGVEVTEDLAGYQTYQNRGLIPGPICTPTAASIDAALEPDTATDYLYFLAIPDGDGTHVFAKTLAEHNANKQKYGYE